MNDWHRRHEWRHELSEPAFLDLSGHRTAAHRVGQAVPVLEHAQDDHEPRRPVRSADPVGVERAEGGFDGGRCGSTMLSGGARTDRGPGSLRAASAAGGLLSAARPIASLAVMACNGGITLTTLARFIVLYAALYAAFGVQSPFLPAFLEARGLEPGSIGLVLASATAIRLVAGPVAGRAADRLQALRGVLAGFTAAAALIALGYLPLRGLGPLLLIGMLHAAFLAPLAPLSDALALGAAVRHGFEYGWVRGAGSAAFVCGLVLSGQAIGQLGLTTIVWLNAALLAATALIATRLPPLPGSPASTVPSGQAPGGIGALLRIPSFRRLMLVAALVLGSHAMHDGFVVIRWGAAGIGPETAGLLWSEQVVSEVIVFLFLGPPLLARLGPSGALAVAAGAGVLRWTVLALTAWLPAMALEEPLHGLTFALLHLASMRLIAQTVPAQLAGTAQTLYGTVAIGTASALLTLISGPLYARFGADGFWIMAGLCAAALPLALRFSAIPAPPSSTL